MKKHETCNGCIYNGKCHHQINDCVEACWDVQESEMKKPKGKEQQNEEASK